MDELTILFTFQGVQINSKIYIFLNQYTVKHCSLYIVQMVNSDIIAKAFKTEELRNWTTICACAFLLDT